VCRVHPRGRVRRDGYYGRYKEFVRWECVPPNGDAPHYLKRSQQADLRVKLVGGRHGSCDECERHWEPTDGLPSASYDKFVLRAKAETLVRVAEGGLTLRGAATEARRLAIELRTGQRPQPWRVSRDGRLGRDWVSQYGELIASHYLPTRWPKAIAVDSFDVRVPGFDPHGNPLRKGRYLYTVIAAVGYSAGSYRGQLWHAAAFPGESEREYRDFFREFGGQPEIVVCDGSWAIRNAAAWAFPQAQVFPCAWHQFNRLRQHLRHAGLWNRRRLIYRLLRDQGRVFSSLARWQELERVLERYLAADRSRLSPQQAAALGAIGRWLDRNRDLIGESAAAFYWPTTISHLEEHLDTIGSRLGDRRRAFRNLHRLNCLLKLFLIQLRGEASASAWARVLRENHRAHDGKPPPRRLYDGQVIRPR
jgi:hypothetical protein